MALHNAMETWYKRQHRRVAEANGRYYLSAIDDLKDHLLMLKVRMSYLVDRGMILPLGKWYNQAHAVRNRYPEAHGLHPKTETFQWKDTRKPTTYPVMESLREQTVPLLVMAVSHEPLQPPVNRKENSYASQG